MKKVLVVFGTRPEAIKMCPLIIEMKKHSCIDTVVCVTGQHKQMLDQVLNVFSIQPDYNLEIMKHNQTLFDITTSALNGLKTVFETEVPDLVLVHGDTPTTFIASLAAFFLRLPVGHVEAGLRTYDLDTPFPEEFNRQATGLIANWHFAPTANAVSNLLAEGKDPDTVFLTGNTVIDALKFTTRDGYTDENLDWVNGSRFVLLTAHRRENWGEPIKSIFRGIRRAIDELKDVKLIFPAHLNPIVQQETHVFDNCDQIRVIPPIDIIKFHNYMSKCHMILTDSGGIQEEACALGKPTLVLRNVTERPEGVDTGILKVIGHTEQSVYENFVRLMNDPDEYRRMSIANNPYGDGLSSKRITKLLISLLEANCSNHEFNQTMPYFLQNKI